MATQLSLMKGLPLPKTVLVEARGHQLLPGSALAVDEHRGIRPGHLQNLGKDPPHDLAQADHPREELLCLHLAQDRGDLVENL